jgi:hypothetical protein
MTRQTKTPKQRAEEALGTARRRRDRATTTYGRLREELVNAETELDEAQRLLDYAAQHPALQPTPTETPNSTGNTNQEESPTA